LPAIVTYALLSIPLIGAYAIFALGVSVIYRASRVLNLAHGAMAMIPAYMTYSLSKAGVPIFFALWISVIAGALLGVLVERFFVRRLRGQGATAQTVGTVAVAGMMIALAAKIWGTTPLLAPQIFPKAVINIGSSGIRSGEIGLFLTACIISAGLFAFFKFTDFGLAMRGSAVNRRAASLMGIDPDIAASAAWALGGGLAGMAGVMLASVTNLDPYTLTLQVLPAFVAALIGGLESLPGALGGAAIAGLAFGIVPYFSNSPVIGSVVRYSGSPQLALTFLALIVMAIRGRRIAGVESSEAGLSSSARPLGSLNSKRLRRWLLISAVFVVVWPFIIPNDFLVASLNWVELSLVATSLVVLIGWVGQVSLAQASFFGIAAFVTGMVTRGMGLGFPVSTLISAAVASGAAVLLGVVALRVRGLYLAVATLIFAWMCDAFLFRTPWLGAGGGSSTMGAQRIGNPAGIPYIDLTNARTLFWLIAPVLGIVVFCLSNLRDTKTGRAFFAVRGSEMAAASLGINVVRTKLVAFAIAGAVAGVAGNLFMTDLRTVGPDQFLFTVSLQFLSIAVIGGLTSLGGAIAAGGLFAALNVLFLRVSALSGWLEVVSAGLLALVLLAYPGGLAALSHGLAPGLGRRAKAFGKWLSDTPKVITSFREKHTWYDPTREASVEVSVESTDEAAPRATPHRARALTLKVRDRAKEMLSNAGQALAKRTAGIRTSHAPSDDWLAEPEVSPNGSNVEPIAGGNGHLERASTIKTGRLRPDLPKNREDRRAMVEAEGISVRFGGLLAVSGAGLSVREGEVTGLIGPNGAGKTTLFNAILGLNEPVAGRVHIHGQEVTHLPPHLRARLGIARTFQVLQLFNELSVFDNLLVATHPHNRSSLVSNMVAGTDTIESEASARRRVRRVLKMLELEEIAHHGVRGLPFGTLRMVELGRALVTGAKLIMLDEPASGLNEAETDRLSAVVSSLRDLGLSVLLIEHDVRMVTGLCDYVYVLDQGQLIAQGTPAQVQRDPRVVAAYLGEPDGANAKEIEEEKAGV
jgi:ABC-type branched-subunit amino acid transport system ATPase component/branched-subunit amino acid ABC-type transport system permease component